MAAETVTVTCTRHNLRCAYLDGPRGRGVKVFHDSAGEECDGSQFTVERRYSVSRNGAHAELLALHLNREAAERAAAERRENCSAPVAVTGEDEP